MIAFIFSSNSVFYTSSGLKIDWILKEAKKKKEREEEENKKISNFLLIRSYKLIEL